jgi:hypothetical protein
MSSFVLELKILALLYGLPAKNLHSSIIEEESLDVEGPASLPPSSPGLLPGMKSNAKSEKLKSDSMTEAGRFGGQ